MITDKVKQYIEENKLCSENLFHDWESFLKLLFDQGGCVEAVLWFEYVLISEQKNSLGGGGYIDKVNPKYMFAETHIFENGMENRSFAEIKEYIKSTVENYPDNKLVPSFYIAD